MPYVLVTLICRYKVSFSNSFFICKPRPSQPRDENPWNSFEYKGFVYGYHRKSLMPDDFRSYCKQLKLISNSKVVELQHEAIPTTHNEKLLTVIESSGFMGYAKLREIVRYMSDQVEFPDDLLIKMDSVGWDPEGNCNDNLNSTVLSSFYISLYLSF